MYDGPVIDAHAHVWADRSYWQAFIDHHGLQLDEEEGFLPHALRYMEESGVVGLNMLLYHSSGYRFDKLDPRPAAAGPGGQPLDRQEPAAERIRRRAGGRARSGRGGAGGRRLQRVGRPTGAEHERPHLLHRPQPGADVPGRAARRAGGQGAAGRQGVKLIPWDYGVMSDDRRMFPALRLLPGTACRSSSAPPATATTTPAPSVGEPGPRSSNALRASRG